MEHLADRISSSGREHFIKANDNEAAAAVAEFEEHHNGSSVAGFVSGVKGFAYFASAFVLNVRKLTITRDDSRRKEIAIERKRKDSSAIADAMGRKEIEDILTEGLRIRRPCRVVGDGSNRDQLVCKSHVNIAHSPGTEASKASRSISRSFDTSFSLVSTALVRFYPMLSVSFFFPSSPSTLFLFSSHSINTHLQLHSVEEKKSKPGQSKRGQDRDGILRHSSSVRFQPLVEVELECRRVLH